MRDVKFIINFIILLFLIAFLNTVTASPDTDLQLSRLLSGFRTYQAAFKQITFDSEDRVIQKSRGRVMIMRPNQFRWETDSPTEQVIITNGKTLCVYDVDLAQATQQPLTEETNINPASLLSGSIKDLNQKVTITIVSSNDGMTFQLVPKRKKDLNFNWLRLRFIKNQLVEMIVFNNLNEESIFQFNQIKMNAPLSIQLFEFRPSYVQGARKKSVRQFKKRAENKRNHIPRYLFADKA